MRTDNFLHLILCCVFWHVVWHTECYVQSDMLFWHRFQDGGRYMDETQETQKMRKADLFPNLSQCKGCGAPFTEKTVKAFLCAVQSQSSNHQSSMLIASRYRFLGFQQLIWGLLDYTIHCYHKFCLDLAHFPTRIAPASWHLFSFYRLGDL